MNSIIEIFTQQDNFGQMLLLGFWATCVVLFYSLMLYSIYMGVKSFVTNLFKKVKVW